MIRTTLRYFKTILKSNKYVQQYNIPLPAETTKPIPMVSKSTYLRIQAYPTRPCPLDRGPSDTGSTLWRPSDTRCSDAYSRAGSTYIWVSLACKNPHDPVGRRLSVVAKRTVFDWKVLLEPYVNLNLNFNGQTCAQRPWLDEDCGSGRTPCTHCSPSRAYNTLENPLNQRKFCNTSTRWEPTAAAAAAADGDYAYVFESSAIRTPL